MGFSFPNDFGIFFFNQKTVGTQQYLVTLSSGSRFPGVLTFYEMPKPNRRATYNSLLTFIFSFSPFAYFSHERLSEEVNIYTEQIRIVFYT